jgi:hypothetical protein
MPSPGSCRVVRAYQDIATIPCILARHDPACRKPSSNVRSKHEIVLHEDKKVYKNASTVGALRHVGGSWDLYAPLRHLHRRQERRTLPPDHAELCGEERRENAEVNGACEVLHGMIRDSACPPSCPARHERGWAKTPMVLTTYGPLCYRHRSLCGKESLPAVQECSRNAKDNCYPRESRIPLSKPLSKPLEAIVKPVLPMSLRET